MVKAPLVLDVLEMIKFLRPVWLTLPSIVILAAPFIFKIPVAPGPPIVKPLTVG